MADLVTGLVCVLVLAVGWYNFRVVKYYSKMLYFAIIAMVLPGIAVLPFTFYKPRNADNVRIVGQFESTFLSPLGVRIEMRDLHHVKSDKPFILMANHQHGIDLIGIAHIVKEVDRVTILAKKALLFVPTFGLAAWLCGIVFINREKPEKARKTMSITLKKIIKQGLKLWIFPEGTRNLDGSLLPFKKGGFHLAVEGQIPIVPMVFSSYKNFFDPHKNIFERGRVIARCLPPVPTTGLTPDDVNALVEKVRSQMVSAFVSVSAEVMQDPGIHPDLLPASN